MSAKIIQFPDRKSEVDRIKGLEDWVEMQFWMYEQHLLKEMEFPGLTENIKTDNSEDTNND